MWEGNNCLGTFVTRITHKDTRYLLKFYVVQGAGNNLLSRSACAAMGLLQVQLDEAYIYDSVFGDLGNMKCQPVKICLCPEAVPYSIHTARRVPIPLIEKVQAELERMERHNVIQRITGPTDWCSAMVPVVKRNREVRICVDWKQLNKAVLRERFVKTYFPDFQARRCFLHLTVPVGTGQFLCTLILQNLLRLSHPLGDTTSTVCHLGSPVLQRYSKG